MPYQINSSRLFLTYPQCPLDKQVVADFLIEKFKPREYLVAHELHANGDPHLHCYLALDEPYRTRDSGFADLPGGYHGNYQGCRSSRNVLRYCTKKEDYVGNIDVTPNVSGLNRRRAFDELVTRVKTPAQLVVEEPLFLHGYCKLKLDYLTFLKDQEEERLPLPKWLPNPWGRILPTFRKTKQRHFWLYSSQPNVGKTTLFAKPLVKEFNGVLRTGSEPYWDINGSECFIILDEYNAAIFPYYALNAMADGTYSYRIFHQGVRCLKDPLIVILSNRSINDIYPNMNVLLHARYREIKLD